MNRDRDIFSLLPAPPTGVNLANLPVPKQEWVERVAGSIASAREMATKINLIFDGDSIAEAWQTRGKCIWEERYDPAGAFNFGIAGDRTEHLLWRLKQGQARGLRPKLIILLAGTNNIRRDSAEQIAEGIASIVGEYRRECPTAALLLHALLPREREADGPLRIKVAKVNSMIATLQGPGVVFQDFGGGFLRPDGSIIEELMPDYLHPSEAGYAIWAEAIQPTVDKYVKASDTPATAGGGQDHLMGNRQIL
jgi:lysophospholipase L1-like esterase